MKHVKWKKGKLYAECKCGRVYNISILKDLSEPFECPICERKRKYKPVRYNKHEIRVQA